MGTTVSRQEFFSIPERLNGNANTVVFYTSLLVKKMRLTEPSIDGLKNYVFAEFQAMTSIINYIYLMQLMIWVSVIFSKVGAKKKQISKNILLFCYNLYYAGNVATGSR
jgi:hypothetical protein